MRTGRLPHFTEDKSEDKQFLKAPSPQCPNHILCFSFTAFCDNKVSCQVWQMLTLDLRCNPILASLSPALVVLPTSFPLYLLSLPPDSPHKHVQGIWLLLFMSVFRASRVHLWLLGVRGREQSCAKQPASAHFHICSTRTGPGWQRPSDPLSLILVSPSTSQPFSVAIH